MPIRCTAVEAAEARGWSKAELAQKTGLSLSTIYNLESGKYQPSSKVVSAIMRVFPDLPYERLFILSADSTQLEAKSSRVEETEREAAAA